MGNKLINVARGMKTVARNKENTEKNEVNAKLNITTCEAYKKVAEDINKNKQLSEQQKKQIGWEDFKCSKN